MTTWKCVMCIATLALLAIVCHAAIGASSDDGGATASATSVNAIGNDTASIPDFDGDGTIGFGDFLIFAGVFGARDGDEKYDVTYDLNGHVGPARCQRRLSVPPAGRAFHGVHADALIAIAA